MKNLPWDLYAQFLDVARHGGLSGAGAVNGLSPATLGRRMLDLEAELGRNLFVRNRTGYRLTPDGEALMARCEAMEGAARDIAGWATEDRLPPLVRFSCGTWMARFLARRATEMLGGEATIRLDLVVAERRANLSHRQSDIGIRAFEPTETNLAASMLGEVAYAVYSARSGDATSRRRWLAVHEDEALSAYLRYPHQNAADRIGLTVSRPSALLDAVLSGAGLAVLPCFAGDVEEGLVRVGEEIAALRHRQWIVVNNEDRHRKEIRAVVDRVTGQVRSDADLFDGRRGRAARLS